MGSLQELLTTLCNRETDILKAMYISSNTILLGTTQAFLLSSFTQRMCSDGTTQAIFNRACMSQFYIPEYETLAWVLSIKTL